MFIQGYGIGFHRDPRVASHPDPNTRSSVSLETQLNPSGSFKLPLLGGKLTEMTYLVAVKHNGRQELRYSPPQAFGTWDLGLVTQPPCPGLFSKKFRVQIFKFLDF